MTDALPIAHDDDILPEGCGCEFCQARDAGVHTESWERLDKIACLECGPAACAVMFPSG